MTVQKGKIICKSVDNHVFFSFLDDHYILEVTVVRRNFRWNKTFGDLYRYHWESLNFFDFLAYYEMFKSMLDKALQRRLQISQQKQVCWFSLKVKKSMADYFLSQISSNIKFEEISRIGKPWATLAQVWFCLKFCFQNRFSCILCWVVKSKLFDYLCMATIS